MLMDDTDTNQAASTSSSPEDILRQFDYLADVSPAFFPGVRERRTPPVSPEEEEEETKRESPEPETESPIRRFRFSTPLREDPPSPLPPFEEPEPPIMSGPPTRAEVEAIAMDVAALPTHDEYNDMIKEIKTLKDALVKTVATSTGTTPPYRPSSAVIASPADFQRSPYAQPAPLDLTSKSGLLLYTDAQWNILRHSIIARLSMYMTHSEFKTSKNYTQNGKII